MQERDSHKPDYASLGISTKAMTFPLKNGEVAYPGTYINVKVFDEYFANYCKTAPAKYISPLVKKIDNLIDLLKISREWFSLCINDNVRVIEMVFNNFSVNYDHDDLYETYKNFIHYDRIEEQLDELASAISQELTDVMNNRISSRIQHQAPYVMGGGHGVTGMVKGAAVAGATNFLLDKAFDAYHNSRDRSQIKKWADSLKISNNQGCLDWVTDRFSDFCNLTPIFIKLQLPKIGLGDFMTTKGGDEWKDILDYSKYEYFHKLIDEETYWERLRYLLSEFPTVNDIYVEIINCDFSCAAELIRIASEFDKELLVIQRLESLLKKDLNTYTFKNKLDFDIEDLRNTYSKWEKIIYFLDAHYIGFDDIKEEKKIISQMKEQFSELGEIETLKDYCDKADELYEYVKSENFPSEISVEEAWGKIGVPNKIGKLDGYIESSIDVYYTDLVTDDIKNHKWVQFEENLKDLRELCETSEGYKKDFALYLYAELLYLYEINVNENQGKPYWHDIEILADLGVISAICWTKGVREKDYKVKSDITHNDMVLANFIAAENLYPPAIYRFGAIYKKQYDSTKFYWHKMVAKKWLMISELFGNEAATELLKKL